MENQMITLQDEINFSLEASSYGHLPVTPFHTALQKVSG
jgi:hypothetical protein